MKKEIGKILKELRKRHNYSREDIAELLGAFGVQVNTRHLERWEHGANYPTIEQFLYLCKLYCVKEPLKVFFDKKYSELMGRDVLNAEGVKKLADFEQLLIESGRYALDAKPESEDIFKNEKVIKLPKRKIRYYENAVSAGLGTGMDTDESKMIDVPDGVPEDADYALKVSGDSMEPTLQDEQYIFIKTQSSLNEGDIGIFFANGNVYVKEYRVIDKKAHLISHNKKYSPIDISECEDFKTFGKVIYPGNYAQL